MSIESKDGTCVIGFVTAGEHVPRQAQPEVPTSRDVLD